MMKKWKFLLAMVLLTGAVGLYLGGCSSSDSVSPLNLVSLKTDTGTALDGATAATGIPLDAAIVATFNKEVDVASATSTSIFISVDGVTISASMDVVGAVVTITPMASLATGTNHKVTITASLKAKDGAGASAAEFTFKSFGPPVVNPPQESNMLSYFNFNGGISDETGAHSPNNSDVVDITYVEDRFGFPGLAASFNGTTSIAEIPNGADYMVGPSFSISFWIKANSAKEGHFVLGLAGWYGFQFEILGGPWDAVDKGVKLATRYDLGSSATDAEDTWWNGQPNGWQGSTFAKEIPAPDGIGLYFKDKWAHVVVTFNATTKVGSMYVNGEKTRSWDFNLWPACTPPCKGPGVVGVKFAGNTTGGGEKLALGFIQAGANRIIADAWADPADPLNNHYQGLMDDLRIWKVALTESEITALYTAEKP